MTCWAWPLLPGRFPRALLRGTLRIPLSLPPGVGSGLPGFGGTEFLWRRLLQFLAPKPAHDDGAVGAAEAEGVGQGVLEVDRAGRMRHEVEVAPLPRLV